MTVNDAVIYVFDAWIGIVSGVVIVGVPAMAMLRRVRKRFTAEIVDDVIAKLDAIYNQSTQNGGADNTIADGIVRLQKHAGIMDKDGRITNRTPG